MYGTSPQCKCTTFFFFFSCSCKRLESVLKLEELLMPQVIDRRIILLSSLHLPLTLEKSFPPKKLFKLSIFLITALRTKGVSSLN